MANIPEVKQEDFLADDILEMIGSSMPMPFAIRVQRPLTEKLVMYITERDARIWNHAYKLGVEKGKKEVDNNTKKD